MWRRRISRPSDGDGSATQRDHTAPAHLKPVARHVSVEALAPRAGRVPLPGCGLRRIRLAPVPPSLERLPHVPLARLRRAGRLACALLVACVVMAALPGCSIKRIALKGVANSLTSGPDVFGTDEDPELVRDALPFGLKTMESLLAALPEHEGLLVTLCKGLNAAHAASV